MSGQQAALLNEKGILSLKLGIYGNQVLILGIETALVVSLEHASLDFPIIPKSTELIMRLGKGSRKR